MDGLAFLLLVVFLWLIIKFNRPLTKIIGVAEEAVDASDDTVKTYANEVYVNNAQKRDEQNKSLNRLDTIITNEEIRDIIFNKKNKSQTA